MQKEPACMVGERDREQDALRWELEDPSAISIPPPFNHGILQLNHQHNYATTPADAVDDLPARWDDEKNFGLTCGDSIVGGFGGANTSEKGVRFPESSPTHGYGNEQLPQESLQRTHSR